MTTPIPTTENHHELKKIVQTICHEIASFPEKMDFSGVTERTDDQLPYFDPKQYEKLLATAVLNKVSQVYTHTRYIYTFFISKKKIEFRES